MHIDKMEKPADDTFYHIYNRGVEKRNIFKEGRDQERFIASLDIFNNQKPTKNDFREAELERVKSNFTQVAGDNRLVSLVAYVLMPNHFHLILKSKTDGGITEFMRKLGTGYTNYFNKKHARVGPLFQGKFKSIVIDGDEYFNYLLHYIHLNPLDTTTLSWRSGAINDPMQAMKYLNDYPWSSYHFYTNRVKSNFTHLDVEEITSLGIDPEDYGRDLVDWLSSENLEDIKKLTLE